MKSLAVYLGVRFVLEMLGILFVGFTVSGERAVVGGWHSSGMDWEYEGIMLDIVIC